MAQGPSSDVYSLGVVLLQMLCGHRKASPALVSGWVNAVEAALLNDTLASIIDPTAGEWPLENAVAFAVCTLSCLEPRRMRRANLRRHVLPELTRLLADTAALVDNTEVVEEEQEQEEVQRSLTTDTARRLGGYQHA
jgi:serine/threonine protein kinase